MPGDRTEQATPQRREKARRDGDFLRSRELTSAAGTLVGVLCLGFLAQRIIDGFRSVLFAALNVSSTGVSQSSDLVKGVLSLRSSIMHAALPVAIVMAAIVFATSLCGVLQGGGFQLSQRAVGLSFERVNPVANAKNLFSLRSAARLGKSLVPAAILVVFAWQRIIRELTLPPFATKRIEVLGEDVYGLLTATAWLLLGWALVDYAVEWRSRESRLMMSREEMKQEFKETEGSPQTRGRIRNLQRQMRRRKVKADVGKAAVVLTNPTHYAVALGFDFASMETPRVLAEGRNLLAEEIKTEARWAGVPIVENPPLARSLFRSVEVGQAIPSDLYAAVAAILANLYRKRTEEEARARRVKQTNTGVPRAASSEDRRISELRGDQGGSRG